MNFDEIHQAGLNFIEGACSTIGRPTELILRPLTGTRYYSPMVTAFSTLMMILLPAISALIRSAASLIPFSHAPRPVGMFSIGDFAELYFLLAAITGIRHLRLMIKMHLEKHSALEGPALPIFQFLPGSGSQWITRGFLEPAFVLLVSVVLQDLFIIQSGLSIFLKISAAALAIKSFIGWYRFYEYKRDILDAQYLSSYIADLADNSTPKEALKSIPLASVPGDIPERLRTQAAMAIARTSPRNK